MAEDNQSADDISQQYQQILNQYASQITPPVPADSSPVPPTPAPPMPPVILLAPTPPVLPSLPLTPSVPPPITPTITPPTPTIKPESNFFKYFFFFSIFVFLGVISALVYTILSSQKIINQPPASVSSPTSVPATVEDNQQPTVIPGQVCQLNDQDFQIGATFPAADGCNTCTCQPDLTISCTEKACPAQP